MFEYKFVRLKADRHGLRGVRVDDQAYHDAIQEHAGKGWRLVQIFAPSVSSYGRAMFYEIIFERPSEYGTG